MPVRRAQIDQIREGAKALRELDPPLNRLARLLDSVADLGQMTFDQSLGDIAVTLPTTISYGAQVATDIRNSTAVALPCDTDVTG